MPANKGNRRSSKQTGKRSAAPLSVTSIPPEAAFERSLAQSSDACVLRGKLLPFATLTSTPSTLLLIHPTNMGVRATNLAAVYSRFRVKALMIKFTAIGGNSGNTGSVIGILDDTTSEGTVPTNAGGTLELRCSGVALPNQGTPSYVYYLPVDKTKWYYCNLDSNDPRFVYPGTIYATSLGGAGGVTAELDFTLVFAGAEDGGVS